MFEYTILVMVLMREGKLYALCNREDDVLETLSYVYSALFLKFMCTYIEGGYTIIHMNELNS